MQNAQPCAEKSDIEKIPTRKDEKTKQNKTKRAELVLLSMEMLFSVVDFRFLGERRVSSLLNDFCFRNWGGRHEKWLDDRSSRQQLVWINGKHHQTNFPTRLQEVLLTLLGKLDPKNPKDDQKIFAASSDSTNTRHSDKSHRRLCRCSRGGAAVSRLHLSLRLSNQINQSTTTTTMHGADCFCFCYCYFLGHTQLELAFQEVAGARLFVRVPPRFGRTLPEQTFDFD